MDWFLYDRDLRHERVKKLRNCNLRIFRMWSLCYSIRVYTGLNFTSSFGKLFFFYISALFCILSFLPVLCRIQRNLHNFYNICIIIDCIVGVRYSVFLFSLIRIGA